MAGNERKEHLGQRRQLLAEKLRSMGVEPATRSSILMSALEVFETADVQKAAEMLQTGEWIAVNSVFREERAFLILLRI
ncbi:hypothetical protein [Anaerotruncus sp. 1XD42-93]|uniref:hypothetical protein n=1 Tax=Anaerotruncus sp. 1XD42-93 TaxID=2320853 RepID=UPI000EA18D32|nr:hypothetical protein [Anaerotruncus sp. 1XD42-93]NBK19165.1 hypothetical protein [Anaerotruncus sp. 1XD42-93]RKJ82491.1 hypothetical protein D7Y41_23795 [Anaerotruncus sp. 1XD22-93]